MKKSKLILLIQTLLLFMLYSKQTEGRTIYVPNDYSTIAAAITNSVNDDVIIIDPGTYSENSMSINKRITITSRWYLANDPQYISQTIIDGGKNTIFETITGSGAQAKISGLTFVNSHKPIIVNDEVTIQHCRFIGTKSDAVSFETNGFGYVGYCRFENVTDDGIDIDSENGHFVIEYNELINCGDDGMEIRMYNTSFVGMTYDIRYNIFSGNAEDGLQLIDYSGDSKRVFNIYRNVFADNEMAGLGCMSDGNTVEDYSGAAMPEKVYFYNNTVIGNKVGVTGGDNFFAVNNIFINNTNEGIKRLRQNSVVAYSIFYGNGTNMNDVIQGNSLLLNQDPKINSSNYELDVTSPCIDTGTVKYIWNSMTVIDVPPSFYNGISPDLGAKEYYGTVQPNVAPNIVINGSYYTTTAIFDLSAVVSDDGLPNNYIGLKWVVEETPNEPNCVGFVTIDNDTLANIKATFSLPGIYKLKITATDGVLSSSKTVTIRFANDSTGNIIDLTYPGTTSFEAEEFNYLYGAQIISSSQAFNQQAVQSLTECDFTEHTLRVAQQNADFYIWVHGKAIDPVTKSIDVTFRDLPTVTVGLPSQLGWVKLSGSYITSAGAWPLLIKANAIGTVWDKIIFTSDNNYNPNTGIVFSGGIWSYLDDGSDQGTAWYGVGFNDAAWASGPAELGYGDIQATIVSYGPDANNKYPTTYFRKSFNVIDHTIYTGLILEAIRDDGMVVYLNGVQVWSDNMPGSFDYQTYASNSVGGSEETKWISNTISNSLVTGTNVLAVEIHQKSASSSDISFDFKLSGIFGVITGSENNNTMVDNQQLKIYPNPSRGQLTVVTPDVSKPFAFSILSIEGKEIYSGTITNGSQQIDLSDRPKGIYLLRVYNDKYAHVEKIIKK